MKKYLPILLPLIFFKFLIQFIGNLNYGFHRDELLHLSVSEHLDWGYFEFPPFIAFIGKLSYFFFDYALWGVRLFPTLTGIAILILCCLMAKEMGGKSKAILLAGISVLAFVPFYRNHTLFQPVAFDQLFWALGFYLVIKYINKENTKDLLLLGLIAGLGLLNKYTMFVWGFGIAIGFIFYNRGSLFKSKWLYISGLIAFLIFIPNLLWQIKQGVPFFDHMRELNDSQLSEQGIWDFVVDQLLIIPTLGISLIGAVSLLISSRLKKYRSLGVAFLVMFTTMWILKAKSYYFFAAYPLVFASGAVKIEQWLSQKPTWNYVVAGFMFLSVLYFIPTMTPVLAIDTYTKWYGVEEENGRFELTGDYADMFGWEEQVALVDSVYRSLTPQEQENSVLWAENYGEAGALKILGKKYNLPNPISRHGSFWYWGYGNPSAEIWISLGNEKEAVEYAFNDCVLIKTITHKYAIDEENGIPLYLCRNPKVNIPEWWAAYENYVFD
ncbi:MAG: glycosyltransferase family 39 protein [Balneolaceae bacterium]